MVVPHSQPGTAQDIVDLIDRLRADEGDSVTILCDNPDFNGQPNCAVICNGDWTGYEDKRFAADTVLDALSMAWVERQLPNPRKVIAESNGHHWVERFNLVCCRDCGFVRRADDQNKPCQGVVKVELRHSRSGVQNSDDPSRDELIESIQYAIGTLSMHIEAYHDFEYQPHEVPPELAELRRLQHHLEGSLISSTGEVASVVSSADRQCAADFYALWCDGCNAHPSNCKRKSTLSSTEGK